MTDRPTATANDVVDAIEKLCRHIVSLRQESLRLAERIIPIEGEKIPAVWDDWLMSVADNLSDQRRRGQIGLDLVVAIVKSADMHLRDAERDFAYIKAQVEAIANDAYLKADWKEWMKRTPGDDPR